MGVENCFVCSILEDEPMSWSQKKANLPAPAGRPRTARLAVEQLETRNLLSAATLAVASGIVHSTENFDNFVIGEYATFLGRAPDAGGFQGWVNQLQNGMSPEAVEAGFVSSTEYIVERGNNAVQWLTGLYNDLLGRAPDAGGLNGWLNALASGMGPNQVAMGFTTSFERESIIIRADYLTYLGRVPSSPEIGAWLNFEAQGHNRADAAAQILASDEFFADHAKSPSRFITAVYQDVLVRTPSTPEVDAWLAVYDSKL
jgi:hypothetical protein